MRLQQALKYLGRWYDARCEAVIYRNPKKPLSVVTGVSGKLLGRQPSLRTNG